MPGAPKPAPDPLTQEVAAILRAQLARRGWTQEQLGQRVRMSQSAISKIMRGEGHIDIYQLYALAGALGLKAVEVLREAERVGHPADNR